MYCEESKASWCLVLNAADGWSGQPMGEPCVIAERCRMKAYGILLGLFGQLCS